MIISQMSILFNDLMNLSNSQKRDFDVKSNYLSKIIKKHFGQCIFWDILWVQQNLFRFNAVCTSQLVLGAEIGSCVIQIRTLSIADCFFNDLLNSIGKKLDDEQDRQIAHQVSRLGIIS